MANLAVERLKAFFRKGGFSFFWVIGVVGLIIFYLVVTLRIDGYLTELRVKDQKLSREIRMLERQIIRSKTMKEKLLHLQNIIENYKALLPSSENLNEIAILLGSSAKNCGLELEKLTFRKAKDKTSIFNLRLKGSFFSFIDFLDKVWSSPFLIGVKDFSLSAAQEGTFLVANLNFIVLER
ncbi:MAG: Pilus assembly protein PilO [bacterium]|nr:Pilus assembly protein PilO [bacterium]